MYGPYVFPSIATDHRGAAEGVIGGGGGAEVPGAEGGADIACPIMFPIASPAPSPAPAPARPPGLAAATLIASAV